MASPRHSDPEAQLRSGLRAVEHAFEQHARQLQQESSALRAHGRERQNVATMLETRLADLVRQVQASEQRGAALTADNTSLRDEKSHLQNDIGELHEELVRLSSQKRSILQTIRDDETEAVHSASVTVHAASVPPVAARRTPVALPPAGLSVRAEQPAQSPPSHGSPESSSGLDSKDFFRKVRLRLTYEQFNSFLANITRLNEHNQSVEETLRCAQSLFGADGHDLFLSFKVLIDSLVDK